MPFTNPALYFRTITSTAVITPDPSTLDADQILEFPSIGVNIIESIDNKYQNNVSVDPATNPDGVKTAFLQDNGRLEDIVSITVKLNSTDTTFINKLKSFSRKKQIEPAFHKVGIFGIAYPKVPTFNLDPTAIVGYFIDSIEITHIGQKQNIVSGTITLKTGGTLV